MPRKKRLTAKNQGCGVVRNMLMLDIVVLTKGMNRYWQASPNKGATGRFIIDMTILRSMAHPMLMYSIVNITKIEPEKIVVREFCTWKTWHREEAVLAMPLLVHMLLSLILLIILQLIKRHK